MRPVNSNLKTLGAMLLAAAGIAGGALMTGCDSAPGHPGPDPEIPRPEAVLSFDKLYSSNCAGCHGANGHGGAALPLNNPVYIALAGEDNIRTTISGGVHGKLMPAFAHSSGGMLTDQQVSILAHGIVTTWGKSDALGGAQVPSYKATLTGDPVHGSEAFSANCASCHGVEGKGSDKVGPIGEPTYLALVSDQYLRSTIISGRPNSIMPNWRNHPAPLADQQVTDIVAYLASKRVVNPGQPYPNK